MSNTEQNAMPDQLAIDDQLIMAVRILRAAELHAAADWVAKSAMEFTDRKIAEFGEPPLPIPNSMDAVEWAKCWLSHVAISPAIANDEGSMIGWFSNAIMVGYDTGRQQYEKSIPPASEPSRTDAVKEAIALTEEHKNHHETTHFTSVKASRACEVIRRFVPLVAALTDAERKLVVTQTHYRALEVLNCELAQDRDRFAERLRIEGAHSERLRALLIEANRKGDQEWQRTHYYNRLRHYATEASEIRDKHADAEKRAKDAEGRYTDRVARLLAESGKTIGALTRKLATVGSALRKLKNATYAKACGKNSLTDSEVYATVADILAAIDAPAGEGAERIKCSAIREAGIVYEAPIAFADHDGKSPGASHFAVSQRFPYKNLLKGHDTGFVTTTGRYVDRKEGARIALAAGQIKRLHFQPAQLFSEDFNHPDDAPSPEPISATTPSTILPATHIAEPDGSFPVSGTGGAAQGSGANPVPMVLHCPKCKLQHIDVDDDTGKWATTRLHRKHLCKPSDGGCGHVWQPFDYATVGVKELAPPPPSAPRFTVEQDPATRCDRHHVLFSALAELGLTEGNDGE